MSDHNGRQCRPRRTRGRLRLHRRLCESGWKNEAVLRVSLSFYLVTGHAPWLPPNSGQWWRRSSITIRREQPESIGPARARILCDVPKIPTRRALRPPNIFRTSRQKMPTPSAKSLAHQRNTSVPVDASLISPPEAGLLDSGDAWHYRVTIQLLGRLRLTAVSSPP